MKIDAMLGAVRASSGTSPETMDTQAAPDAPLAASLSMPRAAGLIVSAHPVRDGDGAMLSALRGDVRDASSVTAPEADDDLIIVSGDDGLFPDVTSDHGSDLIFGTGSLHIHHAVIDIVGDAPSDEGLIITSGDSDLIFDPLSD